MEQTAGSQRVGETSGTGRQKEHQAAHSGADAVVGVDIDYETVRNNMLMVSASGTAVKLG